MKPLIYVAGPITGNPFGCVRDSIPVFRQVREAGCVPFMPQWSVIAEMVESVHYEEWLAYDFDVIGRCDGLIRLSGESNGATREVEHALALSISVRLWGQVEHRNAFRQWARERVAV